MPTGEHPNSRANLRPLDKMTLEERQAIGRNGGIKSGESKREKKKTLEMLELMLSGKISYQEAEMTREQAYILATINKGIENGRVELLELIARLRGELVQKQEVDVKSLPAVLTEELSDEDLKELDPAPKKRGRPKKISIDSEVK